jgi:ribosomal protein S27E
MQNNPAEEWRQLTETYRSMFDGELENLARNIDDLTETAREVLRGEMESRRLTLPGEMPKQGPPHVAGKVVAEAHAGEPGEDGESDESPLEFTWKTLLCECDSSGQAWEIHKALGKAGIDSWVEQPGRDRVSTICVVVAADQIDQAREIAARPIPQEMIDEYDQPTPEFVAPRCPQCGDDDPVLESAEPTNSWLCESCGHQWTEPEAGLDQGS